MEELVKEEIRLYWQYKTQQGAARIAQRAAEFAAEMARKSAEEKLLP